MPRAPERPDDDPAHDPEDEERSAHHGEDAPEVARRHAVGFAGRAGGDRLLAAGSAGRERLHEEQGEKGQKEAAHG